MEKGLTLVIPLYNKINCVRNTLENILANHGEYPFKCIIVDDESTDGSSGIAEEYDTKYPEIFQYIKIKHHGVKNPAIPRNIGIKLAETEYIGFLDADDELCAGFIDRGCRFLDEHPEYSMYGNGNLVCYPNENDENVYDEINYEFTEIHNIIEYINATAQGVHFCAAIYRTEMVKQILFVPEFCEDMLFRIKYYNKFPNIYVDNTTCSSVIINKKWSDSDKWAKPKYPGRFTYEITEAIKDAIPDLEYEFIVYDNGAFYAYKKESQQ